MAKPTLAEITKQMQEMMGMLSTMKAENEKLAEELKAEKAKKVTKLPEIKVSGKVKDGHCFLKFPVADEFRLTLKDGTIVDYLFSTSRSVDIEGMDGWKCKLSIFKSPKKQPK